MMDSKLHAELDKAWKTTCKILFGDELGGIDSYEEWLKGYSAQMGRRKSRLSDRVVSLAMDDYCVGANFISADEIRKVSAPLDINDIKDIDSIIGARF